MSSEKKHHDHELTLEEKVEELKEALDEVTTPGADWKWVSEEAVEAVPKYIKKFPGGEEVEEKDIDDAINERSKAYLNAIGIRGGKQSDAFYGMMIKGWLDREGNAALEDAIKKGDEATALHVMQRAYIQGTTKAKVTSVMTKIEKQEDPKVRLKLYETVAQDIAGPNADYLRVVGQDQMSQAYNILANKQRMIEQYLPEEHKRIYKIHGGHEHGHEHKKAA